MAQLPDELRCRTTLNGQPIPGILLMAHLGMHAKNSYTVIVGPTNIEGQAVLSKASIIKEAEEQLRLALMDYQPIESKFSGGITIQIMTEQDIRNALVAFKQFREHSNYPEGYQQMLEAALLNPLPKEIDSIKVEKLFRSKVERLS